jgi:hypothetical protein
MRIISRNILQLRRSLRGKLLDSLLDTWILDALMIVSPLHLSKRSICSRCLIVMTQMSSREHRATSLPEHCVEHRFLSSFELPHQHGKTYRWRQRPSFVAGIAASTQRFKTSRASRSRRCGRRQHRSVSAEHLRSFLLDAFPSDVRVGSQYAEECWRRWVGSRAPWQDLKEEGNGSAEGRGGGGGAEGRG